MVTIYGDTLEGFSSVSPSGQGGYMLGAEYVVSAGPRPEAAVSEHRIYRVTSIGRPIDPKYLTNKAILLGRHVLTSRHHIYDVLMSENDTDHRRGRGRTSREGVEDSKDELQGPDQRRAPPRA